MFQVLSRALAALALLLPAVAVADPINLKFSFPTSDRSQIYQYTVKPFVDGVNADGGNLVHIEVYFSGAISADFLRQPELIADGTADLALVIAGNMPERFHDASLFELPGLFHDTREASRIFTQLARDGTLSGYQDFYVVEAEVSTPEDIHSRQPISSLADLKGLKIRVNNPIEAEVLQRLGAIPVLLSISRTTEAMSDGTIDAATFPPSMLFQFGIGRLATHHFMIRLGGAAVTLLMNRKKFENLPAAAQSLIGKYGGTRLSDYSRTKFDELDRQVLRGLDSDPGRTVVFPSPADEKTIQAVFKEVIAQWAGVSDRNHALLTRLRAEQTKLLTRE